MWLLLLLILSIYLVLVYTRRREHFALFNKLGLSGPTPSVLTGNLLQLSKLGHTEAFRKWQRLFGDTYGYFYGLQPIIVTTDVELLRKVLLKDAHVFYNRMFQFNLDTPHPVAGRQVHILRDANEIKAVRTQFTSAFTSSKLKKVIQTQEDAIRLFLEVVKPFAVAGNAFEVSKPLKRLAMDVVSRTTFGLALPVQTAEKVPEILYLCEKIALESLTSKTEFLATCLPASITQPTLRALYAVKLLAHSMDPLVKKIGAVIDVRRGNPDRYGTIVDNLLYKKILGRQMTEEEIMANAATAFFAGFDTSAVTLTLIVYRLGRHPEWQEKLRDEIRELWNEADASASISSLKLLDRFISETLRLQPPVPAFVLREAAKDYWHGSLLIPQGTSIQVPLTVLQRDPKVFPKPNEFDPDRFALNLPSAYYMPFGEGPRSCVGMRFALTLVKQTTVRLLQNYRVHLSKQLQATQDPLMEDSRILTRTKDILVRLELLEG
ncbi:cytochrome P450 3A24-like [Varroa destructor]|uniref:Cytochrome P450 n=1 Tax=Varroa destructor TaxID=109461 RepID=A0A7M7IZZ0_VARDE|nr:cytochrome P450 3A24-like [Varroa destructor]